MQYFLSVYPMWRGVGPSRRRLCLHCPTSFHGRDDTLAISPTRTFNEASLAGASGF